jgi:hypothetical protein
MTETTNTPSENNPEQKTSSEQTQATAANSQELDQRIGGVQTQVSVLRKQFSRGATATAVVGVLMLVLLCGYFGFGYTQISKLFDLDGEGSLLDLAIGRMEQIDLPTSVEESRMRLEREVKQRSPTWAEQASQMFQESLPEIRTQLEDYLNNQAEEKIGEVVLFGEKEFRKALQENRDDLQTGFKELASSVTLSNETRELYKATLGKQLEQNIQGHVDSTLEIVKILNYKAKTLSKGEGLDEGDTKMRVVLMQVKRWHLEQLDPTLKDQMIPAGKKIVPLEDEVQGKDANPKEKL